MHEPAFWWRPRGPAARLLAPVAAVYGGIAAWRMAQAGHGAGIPVVCIGNLTVGGAGKTPTAIAVADLLRQAGRQPFLLSRGYGGTLPGPLRVDASRHRAREIGDEPLLLARAAPTIVAADRVAGAELARQQGADVIVMDDGFQNPALSKNLSIVVVDGRRGIGNGAVLPAGPLRAPLAPQLGRAHALLVIGPPAGAAAIAATARHLPIFHGRLAPDPSALAALQGRNVLAFAGIGDPQKFFTTLVEAGVAVAARQAIPDHHRYGAAEAAALLARAAREGLTLVSTEKDVARLAGEVELQALAAQTRALPVALVIEETAAFRDLVIGAAN